MTYYSKNGSFPQPCTDDTAGWIEVSDPPEIPEGKRLVWLNGEWVVRDPRPQDNPGFQWNWNHEEKAWIEYPAYQPPQPEDREGFMWIWDPNVDEWKEHPIAIE